VKTQALHYRPRYKCLDFNIHNCFVRTPNAVKKYGRAKLFLVPLRCAKLNPLHSVFSYITIKYIILNISGKADGGGDFHYPDNVNTSDLCLDSMETERIFCFPSINLSLSIQHF